MLQDNLHMPYLNQTSQYAVKSHAVAISVISRFHHHPALLVVCTLLFLISCVHFIKPGKTI